jgi:hypothetical protein
MADDHTGSSPTALCFRDDACRALERKAVWLSRAQYWEELSLKTVEHLLASVAFTDKP